MNQQGPKVGLEEINEKLDRLLAYQRAGMIWGVIKGIFWVAMIILLVVLPFYAIYAFVQNPFEYIDPSQFPPEIKKMIEEGIKNAAR